MSNPFYIVDHIQPTSTGPVHMKTPTSASVQKFEYKFNQ